MFLISLFIPGPNISEIFGPVQHCTMSQKCDEGNRNIRKRCEICSKLIIKTPEQRH